MVEDPKQPTRLGHPRAVATHEAGAPPHEIHSATARAAGGGSHQQHVRAWEQVGGVHDRVRSVQGCVRIADPRPGVRVCPRRRARQRNSSGCGTRGAHGGGVLGRKSRGHVDDVHTCRSTWDGGGRSARRQSSPSLVSSPPNHHRALIVSSDGWCSARELPVAHHHPSVVVKASSSS
jgi:hypothetical protein